MAPQVFENFNTCFMKTTFFWAAICISTAVTAQISGTGFEEPEIFNNPYTDTGDPAVAHDLINNTNEPLVDYNASSDELGFNARYVPYDNPGDGLTDGDTVGVTDAPPNNGNPFPEGLNGYEISDVDGNFILEFDPLVVSSPTISINYFISETGYEGDGTSNASGSDRLRIYVKNLDDTLEYDLLNTTGSDINDLGIEGTWNTASVQLTDSPDSNIQVIIEARNNSAAEAFFFDNLIIEGVLGLPDDSKVHFLVYPNPTSGFVTIQSTLAANIEVQVFTVLGEKIIETALVDSILDVSTLQTGAYVLKIIQGSGISTKKLIVQR